MARKDERCDECTEYKFQDRYCGTCYKGKVENEEEGTVSADFWCPLFNSIHEDDEDEE